MCTAVEGGSIHRAARRLIAASDHAITTPMTSQPTKDRRTAFRRRILVRVSGLSVTLQNNSLGLWIMDDLARLARRVQRSTQRKQSIGSGLPTPVIFVSGMRFAAQNIIGRTDGPYLWRETRYKILSFARCWRHG